MFEFTPVVRDLPTLAKTIGGRLEVVEDRIHSRWVARIVGPRDCHVGFRFKRHEGIGLMSSSSSAFTPKLARLRLARLLSRNTFVVYDTQVGKEHYLPLGVIRP